MKSHLETIQIPQDPDEPRLTGIIYQDSNSAFQIDIEVGGLPSLDLTLHATNLSDTRAGVRKLLHIIRALRRLSMGKSPDLPEHLKDIEAELPAYRNFLASQFQAEVKFPLLPGEN
jgi:hypothetical protein